MSWINYGYKNNLVGCYARKPMRISAARKKNFDVLIDRKAMRNRRSCSNNSAADGHAADLSADIGDRNAGRIIAFYDCGIHAGAHEADLAPGRAWSRYPHWRICNEIYSWRDKNISAHSRRSKSVESIIDGCLD